MRRASALRFDPDADDASSDSPIERLADFLPQLVWTCTPDGHCDFLSRRWVEYTGIGAAEQLGTSWLAQLHPDDRERTWAAWQDWMARADARSEFRILFRLRRHDGAYRWFDTRGVPLHDERGTLLKVFGSNTDVHDEYELREQLHREQELLEKIVASAPGTVCAFRMAPDGRATCPYASAGIVEIYGIPIEELRVDASGALARIHPDDRASVQATIAESARDLSLWQTEYRVQHPTRGEIWIEGRSLPTREPDGCVRWDGFLTDVTERKRSERALEASRRSYQDLVDLSPDAVIVHRGGYLAFANPAAVALFGASRGEELVGRHWTTCYHPDFHELIRARLDELYAGRSVPPLDERIVRLDGTTREVEVAAAPFTYGGERAVQVILRDVSERRRAQEELRESKARLVAALEATGTSTFIWDLATDAVRWDEAAERLWRTLGGPSDTSPARLGERIHADDLPRVLELNDRLRRGEMDTFEIAIRIPDPAGGVRWLACRGSTERDAGGLALRVIGSVVDVTDRKQIEEAQVLSQKLEALGTLAGGIAHDFNNILLAILGNAELIEVDLEAGHPARESASQITQASLRAADLVRRILAFSRPTEHRRERLAIEPIVHETRLLLRATLPASVEIDARIREPIPAIRADASQLHQILVNLVTNAAHAIGDRPGRIELGVEPVRIEGPRPPPLSELPDGDYVCVSVSDDGAGMDAATRERIFDPFFTTKPVGRGTGLGLSVVHGIVRAHGGVVTVESEPGQGASFRVYFPTASAIDS